jgi:hypothetical protein
MHGGSIGASQHGFFFLLSTGELPPSRNQGSVVHVKAGGCQFATSTDTTSQLALNTWFCWTTGLAAGLLLGGLRPGQPEFPGPITRNTRFDRTIRSTSGTQVIL